MQRLGETSWIRRMQFPVVGLLLLHALLLAYPGWTMSPNPTEVAHMAATIHLWKTHRNDVFHVNPPLMRVITGWTVVLCDPCFDSASYSTQPMDRCEWKMGKDFLAANTHESLRWYFALARWASIPFLIGCGYVGYRFSGELYGEAAGLIFLALWSFSPLLLGWGPTVCPDVLAGGLGLVAAYVLLRWLRRPTLLRAVIAGAFLGLLPLTKMTWLIAFCVWPLVYLFWVVLAWTRNGAKNAISLSSLPQLAVLLLVGLCTLNAGYLFDGTLQPLQSYDFHSQWLTGDEHPDDRQAWTTGNRVSGSWLGTIPVPLPREFVQGLDTQRVDFERGRLSYLAGQWSNRGWWYYYLYALAAKMPLGTWFLLLLTVFVTCFRREYNAVWEEEAVLLLPMVAIFVLVSSQTGISANMRYIIPALPFLFVWIAKLAKAYVRRDWTISAITSMLVAWMAVSSLSVYPHSLSYFNEFAGGPTNGPEHLLGSNTDWGQELFYLKRWCENHPEAHPISVAFWGTYPAEVSGIRSVGDPPSGPHALFTEEGVSLAKLGPQPGWFALSVNEIYRRSRRYRYFLDFEPVATTGYSIYIYNITLEDANRARREFGLPKLPKDWDRTQECAQP